MLSFNIFLITSLVFLSLYLVGLGNFLFSHEKNSCSMTYMYEFPQFIKINVSDRPDLEKYGLYAYSEGRLTEKARNMHFDGIPVLFIPGNAGSYKQVRSLASVSLRKYINSRARFHFDYFTVDLNEEYSGLFGGVLEFQSQFINLSINTILNLYDKQYSHPKSVILIGHSIGGLIAQNVLTIENNSEKVNTIITLASPNKSPIATLDYLIPKFYSDTFDYWDKNLPNINNSKSKFNIKISDNTKITNSSLSNVLFISIGGGFRDILVPSSLTSSRYGHVNVLTTAIPMVWLSTDHQCIVWCLQLVLVLNRLLFNMVDTKSKQISMKFEEKYETALRHLTLTSQPAHSKPISFRINSEWYEDNRRIFSVRFMKGLNNTRYQMVRLFDSNMHQMLAVETLNLDDDDWIFGCNANHVNIKDQSRVCKKGYSLSNHTRPHPSLKYKRHIAYLDLHKIKRQNPDWTHVIFQISPTDEPVQLNFDIYNREQRILKAIAPKLLSLTKSEIVTDTLSGAVHYDMIISSFDSIYQALHLYIDPKGCSGKSYHSVATAFLPWAPGHTSIHYFTETQMEPMSIRLHQPSAAGSTKNLRVRLVLDPNCKYTLSLKSSFIDVLGQMARNYSLHLIPYCACILILAIRQQILQVQKEKQCSNLLLSMTTGAKPYYVVTIAKLAQKFLSTDHTMPILLPLILFVIAWAIIYIVGLIVYAGVSVAGKFAHTLILRIISLGSYGFAANTLQRLPSLMGVVAIAIGAATCGCVSLLIAVIIYSIILSKMYEDYTETIVFKTIRSIFKTIVALFSKNSSNLYKETSDKDGKSDEKYTSNLVQNENKNKTKCDITQSTSTNKTEFSNQKNLNQEDFEASDNHDKHDKSSKETLSANDPENIKKDDNQESVINKVVNKAVDIVLPESDITLSVIHFNITLFLLLLFTTVLNFSSLLVWSHNFKYAPYLERDPTFWTSIIICTCLSILWQIEFPKTNLLFSTELGYILYALSIGCLIVSNIALYAINYFLASTFILITVHQCMPFFGIAANLFEGGTVLTENIEKSKEDIEDEILVNKVKVIRTKLQEE